MNRKVQQIEINVDSGSQQHTYYFVNDLPEDIIKKVKRYYSSGTLFEGKRDDGGKTYYMDESTKDYFKS
jgi:hypothetical protein